MLIQNNELLRIDSDYLNIKCVELLRIKALKKYGLAYFENIVEQVKKNGFCDINKQDFESKLELASQKIQSVYIQEKQRQKKYNLNRGNKNNIEQASPSNNVIQLSNMNQIQQVANAGYMEQRTQRIFVSEVGCQTDDAWIRKIEQDFHRLKETMDKLLIAKQKLETDSLHIKKKESRLNIQIDKKDKDILKYKSRNDEMEKQQKHLNTVINEQNKALDIYRANEKKYKDSIKYYEDRLLKK